MLKAHSVCDVTSHATAVMQVYAQSEVRLRMCATHASPSSMDMALWVLTRQEDYIVPDLDAHYVQTAGLGSQRQRMLSCAATASHPSSGDHFPLRAICMPSRGLCA